MILETSVGSIKLRNPMILASGVLGASYSTLQRVYEGGLGAVVTKTVGSKPRIGNPNPSIFALQKIKALMNSVGLANPGYQQYREDIKMLIKNDIPTIVSIFGESRTEFNEVLEGLKDLSILGFELNFSCPNLDKEEKIIGTDADLVKTIVQDLRKKTQLPIWVKLTPNVSDMMEIADSAIKGGCDALVAINTLKAMVIDIYTKRPILGNKRGGLSGAPIKPIGIRYVYDLYEQFGNKVPIVGVGGISKGEDIIEYLLAGASAVEIGTALGVAYPENIIKFFQMRMKKYMKDEEVEKITDLIGGAHK